MMHKLFVSVTLAGLVCGYVAILYALIHTVVLLDNSYFQSPAMYTVGL
jgi:hypothetical protein